MRDISKSVDKLVQISRAIKKSSTPNRSLRAEAYEEWEDGPDGKINLSKGFEDFIGVLLEYRYRDVHENLRNRLRIAISRCHRRIAYQRRHHVRYRRDITRNRSKLASPSAVIAPTALPSQLPTSGSSDQIVTPHEGAHLEASVVVPSQQGTIFSASTLSPNFSPFDYDDKSSISSGSSFARLSGNPKHDLPPPPIFNGNERYFQCPYCCIQLPRKTSRKRAWVYVNPGLSVSVG